MVFTTSLASFKSNLMNERPKSELQELVIKIKKSQPDKHPKSVHQYMFELQRLCIGYPDLVILESTKVYNDDELYKDKPIVYLMAVLRNKREEFIKDKAKYSNRLSQIPNPKTDE